MRVVQLRCMWSVACCILSVGCRILHDATPYARSRGMHTCARARKRAIVTPLSVLPWAVRWSGFSVARTPTLNCSRLPHISCTAAAPHPSPRSSAGVAARTDRGHRPCCREVPVGGHDREEPGRLVHRASASLQGTPQRRRWALAARMVLRACCTLPAHICLLLPHVSLT